MKKLLTFIIVSFCLFSIGVTFNHNLVAIAEDNPPVETQKVVDTNNKDVLDKPVFDDEEEAPKPVKSKLSSWLIRILGGILLLLVAVICLSFIIIANIQRKREKIKKKNSDDINIVTSIDNYARHRIKR